MLKEINRRKFIKTSAVAGLAVSVAPNIILGQDDRRVRLGFIGVGRQGTGLLKMCLSMDDVDVNAICDIDKEALTRAQKLDVLSSLANLAGYVSVILAA